MEDYQKPRKRKKNLINEQNLKHIYTPASAFKEFNQNQDIDKAP